MDEATIEILDEDTFDDFIRRAPFPVLVDFWATWCAPCKRVAVSLDALAVEFSGRLDIVRVDVDDSGDLANRFGIRNIPTLVIMREGHVVDQMVGAAPENEIRAMILRHVARSAAK